MKIGFDAKRYYHNNTGLGNYSRTLVKGLQTLFPESDYVLYDEKSLSRTLRLGAKALKDGCDIYHGLSNELPLDSHRLPSVVTIHDVCWRTYPEMYHFFDRKIYDLKYGSSCRRADKVIAISESTKRDIIDIYNIPEERIEVICQPVAECFYRAVGPKGFKDPKDPKDPKDFKDSKDFKDLKAPKDYVLYVGSINARKNLLGVLEALTLMPEERRPVLVVVGSGHEYKTRCEEYIQKHALQKYVVMLGAVKGLETLQQLYAGARVFLYPSFYEGFGLPVVEAALQHTPVITSTVSSLPEAAGPDACLIDPYAPDAAEHLAHHLDRLLTDTAYHEEVATKMEAYARRMFSPEVQPRKLMKLYESLI